MTLLESFKENFSKEYLTVDLLWTLVDLETFDRTHRNLRNLDQVKLEFVKHKSVFDFEKIFYRIQAEPIKKKCLQVFQKLNRIGSLSVFADYHTKSLGFRNYIKHILLSQFHDEAVFQE